MKTTYNKRGFYKLQILLIIGMVISIGCSSDDDNQSVTEFQSINEDIEALSGQILFLEEAPVSVELNELVSDTTLFVFAEKLNHTLLTTIQTDLSIPGDFFPDTIPNDQQTWEALIPGEIPAGTKVSSYYFHYDNETYNDTFDVNNYFNCIGQYQVNAQIQFTKPVLGIVMRAGLGIQDHLGNSNAELGLPSVSYSVDNLTEYPGINIADGCQSDRFILSEDRKTLILKNNSDIHHDNYRVILSAED